MKKLYLMLLLLSFPKPKNFNHLEIFTEFIGGLVNLKYKLVIIKKHLYSHGADVFLFKSVVNL
ncbi:hypothetical protein COE15_03770 [Bacillus cereus]|nr:hypothetical protein CN288_03080 [Bacillus sp. AFS023182]PGY04392.1 hypothetical protein COE15_03770 [Bacillus cereus]